LKVKVEDQTITRAVQDFLESLAGRSTNTGATYATGLNKLLEYIRSSQRNSPNLNPDTAGTRALPDDLLEGFYLWLSRGNDSARQQPGGRPRKAKASATSVATYVAASSAWVRYLDRRRLLPEGVSYERMRGDLAAVKARQTYKTPRVDDRIVLLLQSVDRAAHQVPGWFRGAESPTSDTPSPSPNERRRWLEILRDRALIHVLFSGALRREEASSLNRSDLKDGRAKRAVITGKGNKERVAFFGPEALNAVREYLLARSDSHEPLFLRHDRARSTNPGTNGEGWRMSPHAVWEAVKKWSKIAGVRATTHHLRHAKASIMLNEGAKLEEVQDLLGHASPQTTKLIYAHYTVEHLEDAFDRFSPSSEDLIERLGFEP